MRCVHKENLFEKNDLKDKESGDRDIWKNIKIMARFYLRSNCK